MVQGIILPCKNNIFSLRKNEVSRPGTKRGPKSGVKRRFSALFLCAGGLKNRKPCIRCTAQLKKLQGQPSGKGGCPHGAVPAGRSRASRGRRHGGLVYLLAEP